MSGPGAGESPWTLIEHSQDIIVVLDENGEITYVNPAVEAVLGYHPPELVDTNVFDLIHPEDRDELRERFVSTIKQEGEEIDPNSPFERGGRTRVTLRNGNRSDFYPAGDRG